MVKRANSCSRLIKRLERLESKRPQRDRSNAGGREALVLCGRFEGESHFAVTFQKGSYWRIEQVPGPGPGLWDRVSGDGTPPISFDTAPAETQRDVRPFRRRVAFRGDLP